MKLPDGRIIDMERVALERGAVESGRTTLDSVEARETDGAGDTNEVRLRADRLVVRGTRIDPSGARTFATAEADGIGQGRVELEIPLPGKLDAPGFDFDALVTQALATAALESAQEGPPKGE